MRPKDALGSIRGLSNIMLKIRLVSRIDEPAKEVEHFKAEKITISLFLTQCLSLIYFIFNDFFFSPLQAWTTTKKHKNERKNWEKCLDRNTSLILKQWSRETRKIRFSPSNSIIFYFSFALVSRDGRFDKTVEWNVGTVRFS